MVHDSKLIGRLYLRKKAINEMFFLIQLETRLSSKLVVQSKYLACLGSSIVNQQLVISWMGVKNGNSKTQHPELNFSMSDNPRKLKGKICSNPSFLWCRVAEKKI
jgi:hypothetical protein